MSADYERAWRFAESDIGRREPLRRGWLGHGKRRDLVGLARPFGGVKASGLGREGGGAGMSYLETKYIEHRQHDRRRPRCHPSEVSRTIAASPAL